MFYTNPGSELNIVATCVLSVSVESSTNYAWMFPRRESFVVICVNIFYHNQLLFFTYQNKKSAIRLPNRHPFLSLEILVKFKSQIFVTKMSHTPKSSLGFLIDFSLWLKIIYWRLCHVPIYIHRIMYTLQIFNCNFFFINFDLNFPIYLELESRSETRHGLWTSHLKTWDDSPSRLTGVARILWLLLDLHFDRVFVFVWNVDTFTCIERLKLLLKYCCWLACFKIVLWT